MTFQLFPLTNSQDLLMFLCLSPKIRFQPAWLAYSPVLTNTSTHAIHLCTLRARVLSANPVLANTSQFSWQLVLLCKQHVKIWFACLKNIESKKSNTFKPQIKAILLIPFNLRRVFQVTHVRSHSSLWMCLLLGCFASVSVHM